MDSVSSQVPHRNLSLRFPHPVPGPDHQGLVGVSGPQTERCVFTLDKTESDL